MAVFIPDDPDGRSDCTGHPFFIAQGSHLYRTGNLDHERRSQDLSDSQYIYVEPFLPTQAFYIVRPDVREFANEFAVDVSEHYMELKRKYNMSFDLDYSFRMEQDQIVITYTGTGKHGTVETIAFVDSYPLLKWSRIEDQTAGAWDPPRLPWEIRISSDFQDPARVIDPPLWPEDIPTA